MVKRIKVSGIVGITLPKEITLLKDRYLSPRNAPIYLLEISPINTPIITNINTHRNTSTNPLRSSYIYIY